MRVWAAAGAVLGVALALLLFAPAAWIAAAIDRASDARVLLVEPRGTVWNGAARLVLSGGESSTDAVALPGRIQWQLRPAWGSLRLRLQSTCCAPAGLSVELQPSLRGLRMVFSDASSDWPAEILAGLGAPWNTVRARGQLELHSKGLSVEWLDGRASVLGSATLDAMGLSSGLSTLKPIGSYRMQLTGAGPSNQPRMELLTRDGSLILTGSGQWNGERWNFRGQASASAELEPVLGNLLNIIGRRQGNTSVIALD